MKITEYFDPCVIEHLRAFKHLQNNGFWPTDFLPDGIEFPELWQITLQSKMAGEWINLILGFEEAHEKA